MDRETETILIVDDNPQNIVILEMHISNLGYNVVKAQSGKKALNYIYSEPIDLVLLDVMMPELDGYEVCKRIKNKDETRFIPVIMVSALKDVEDRIKGIEAGADDFLSKPYNKIELQTRIKSLLKVKRLNEELEQTRNVIYSLATALEANDPYTHGHSNRVSNLSVEIAKLIGLSKKEQKTIKEASILHDIGKIGINVSIIHKPGPLTQEEYSVIKEHPVIGEKICSHLKFAQPMIPVIRHHHERIDGKGYPDGLKGEEIPLHAKIVAVADAYDAFTSKRPYRKELSSEETFSIIREEAIKGRWDRDIVESLYSIVTKGFGEFESAGITIK